MPEPYRIFTQQLHDTHIEALLGCASVSKQKYKLDQEELD